MRPHACSVAATRDARDDEGHRSQHGDAQGPPREDDGRQRLGIVALKGDFESIDVTSTVKIVKNMSELVARCGATDGRSIGLFIHKYRRAGVVSDAAAPLSA